MYNEEIKRRFLEERSTNISSRNALVYLFNKFEPYEKEINTDICAMNTIDLERALGGVLGVKQYARSTKLYILKYYVRWCINNGIDGACDSMLHINDEDIDVCDAVRSKWVASPAQLQKCMDVIFDKVDDLTSDNVYRCYLWMAYGGLNDDVEAFEVTTNEIDFENMIFCHNNREYIIYDESLSVFRNCVELNYFNVFSGKSTRQEYRANSAQIIRRIAKRDTLSVKGFRSEVSRRVRAKKNMPSNPTNKEFLSVDISFDRLWLSGVFYRMYEAECVGISPDFAPVVQMVYGSREYNFSKTNTVIKTKLKKMTRVYEADYDRWKNAYELF